MKMARFDLRSLFLVITGIAICVAVLAYREQQRLKLIQKVLEFGGTVETRPALLPFSTGEVVEVSIPFAAYKNDEFPRLTQFKNMEMLRLIDFESDILGCDALEVSAPEAINRFAKRDSLEAFGLSDVD